jgi:hypothetical protein
VFYAFFSAFIPSLPALIFSVLIVQFSASLLTVYLLYHFFLENFSLDVRQSILVVIFIDSIFLSPFLILAVSEILFIFYQILAWTCFLRGRYFFAALSTAMTFALRFNGAFFVVGMFLMFFLKWWKSQDISPRLLLKTGVTLLLMFIVGFSSFIITAFGFGDFWLPLTSQLEYYLSDLEYVGGSVFSIPFLWWLRYIQWVIVSGSLMELLFLITTLATLVLGIFSLYALYKWMKEDRVEQRTQLPLLFVCGFLGANFIASGSNFARFLSFVFPVFPIFPLLIRNHNLSSRNQLILFIGSGIWALLFNIGWWMSYPV